MKSNKRSLWTKYQNLLKIHSVAVHNMNTFTEANKEELESISRQIRVIQDEYFEIDEKNQIIIENNKSPKMKEGKTLKEFDEAYKQLMSKDATING